MRAVSKHPAGPAVPLPINGDDGAAFQLSYALGVPGVAVSGLTHTAHMLACLRINGGVTVAAARLASSLPGSALAGRDSHPLDGYSEFQGGIVSSYPFGPALPGRII